MAGRTKSQTLPPPGAERISKASQTYDRSAGPRDSDVKDLSLEELAFRHQKLIKRIVLKLHAAIPAARIDDLTQCCLTGLWQAQQRFVLPSPSSFASFAYYRMYGECLDWVYTIDNSSRDLRALVRILRNVESELTNYLRRPPKYTETAAFLGWSEDRVLTVLAREEERRHLSLGLGGTGGLATPSNLVTPANVHDLYPDLLLAEVREVVDRLHESQRWLFEQYFGQGKLLREIAAELGITESGVAQKVRGLRHTIAGQLDEMGFKIDPKRIYVRGMPSAQAVATETGFGAHTIANIYKADFGAETHEVADLVLGVSHYLGAPEAKIAKLRIVLTTAQTADDRGERSRHSAILETAFNLPSPLSIFNFAATSSLTPIEVVALVRKRSRQIQVDNAYRALRILETAYSADPAKLLEYRRGWLATRAGAGAEKATSGQLADTHQLSVGVDLPLPVAGA